jgi:hypothetical protein
MTLRAAVIVPATLLFFRWAWPSAQPAEKTLDTGPPRSGASARPISDLEFIANIWRGRSGPPSLTSHASRYRSITLLSHDEGGWVRKESARGKDFSETWRNCSTDASGRVAKTALRAAGGHSLPA